MRSSLLVVRNFFIWFGLCSLVLDGALPLVLYVVLRLGICEFLVLWFELERNLFEGIV